MGVRFQELLLLLAVCSLARSDPANKTAKKEPSDNFLYQYEDYDSSDDHEEVLFNEDKPCPRDCICTVSQGYRIAKCNRLEIGTQKFGDDITDLVLENLDPKYPIDLEDSIIKKLGLHQISTIKIVNSTISSVSPNAFQGLNELYAVHLSNNNLKTLHPETFANNKKLLLLTLSNNPLKFPVKGSEDYFLNSSSVQELDVSNCNMQYITANTFQKMPGLMYLNVVGNSLSDLDPDAFKKLLDLEELDLSDNNIKSLPDDIFIENTELATLHIQRNPIDTVYGLQLPDLLTLNAGQTNIKFVGPSMFSGMTYIANLNLTGNGIEKIHNQAFHKLVELNYLDLSYNDLDFVSGILIKENIELDIFKISNNPKLKHLPEKGFECTANEFNIYMFDASNCAFEDIPDDALKTFTGLSQINLSGNKIKSLNSRVFSRAPKLVDINLANNLITTLDIEAFAQNTELGKLNLRGNPLRFLSPELFIKTKSLTWLDMSHTELTTMWKVDKDYTLPKLSSLRFFNISNNRINEITQAELDSIDKISTFDINNNPLACSRDFENLMTWLTKRKVSSSATSLSIANLGRDSKTSENTYTWESLARKTCNTDLNIIISTSSVAPVSDEEIWERIDKDADGNFDLKDTLDDAKDPDDKKIDVETGKADDDLDDDTDDDNIEDEIDDQDDDDADYDSDIDLKVKLNDITSEKFKTSTSIPKIGDIEIAVKLLENDIVNDDMQQKMYVQAVVKDNKEHNHNRYWWNILNIICGAFILLVVISKLVYIISLRRNGKIRYNSAIVTAMNNQGRTKKDCGLVYQQLSEDVSGPVTPKLSRYAPLHTVTVNASNLSYESSPFHHNKIVPEAV